MRKNEHQSQILKREKRKFFWSRVFSFATWRWKAFGCVFIKGYSSLETSWIWKLLRIGPWQCLKILLDLEFEMFVWEDLINTYCIHCVSEVLFSLYFSRYVLFFKVWSIIYKKIIIKVWFKDFNLTETFLSLAIRIESLLKYNDVERNLKI